MVKIYYSPQFAKAYKRLPPNIQLIAEKKEKIFRKNPFDPRLRTHRLAGRLQVYWSFSINYRYRIIFSFDKSTDVHLHTVGTHGIYAQ